MLNGPFINDPTDPNFFGPVPLPTAPTAAPSPADDLLLQQLLGQLNQPLLRLPAEPDRSNLSKFALAVAGAQNPNFAARFIEPEIAERRSRPFQEAQFQALQEQRRESGLQRLLTVQSLIQNRAEQQRIAQEKIEIARQDALRRQMDAEVRRVLNQTRIRDLQLRGKLATARTDNDRIRILQGVRSAELASLREMDTRFRDETGTIPAAMQPVLDEQAARIEELDQEIEAARRGEVAPNAPLPPRRSFGQRGARTSDLFGLLE